MITDVMREAESEHEIYFLLTAYLEALRFSDKLNLLPAPLERLPITGMADVGKRFEQLFIELDSASKGLNNNACIVIKEALHIFSTAFNRLASLPGRNSPSLPEHRKGERRLVSSSILRKPHTPDTQHEIRTV